MPVKRRTINLNVVSNSIVATDAGTGLVTSDAGLQGEDGAIYFHVAVPDDWSGLAVRLVILSSSGTCDESGLPLAGVIDMPLRSIVSVPGRLTVSLVGTSADGVRRAAECDSLYVTAQQCPEDAAAEVYPLALENLRSEIDSGVVHKITGSGGAKVTKTGDTTYDINVTGTGGDMLEANYATGSGSGNPNAVDHAAYADKTDSVEHASFAVNADTAASAQSAAPGSALAQAIDSKQAALTPGGTGTDILSGTTVKSLKTRGLSINSDTNSITLGFDDSVFSSGTIMYTGAVMPPTGWAIANGRQLKIDDNLNLYGKFGDRFGIGTTGYIMVAVTCYSNNRDFARNIVLQKYALGIQTVSYFASSGIVFTAGAKITSAGDYTFYCKDSDGREEVQYANIPDITAPYILDVCSAGLDSNYKLTLYETTFMESPDATEDISIVKLASGIQTISYFQTSGVTIGSADHVVTAFQAGTSLTSGIYTWYTKSSDGKEAIQYFKVIADAVLAMSLHITYGTDYFRVPNLVDANNPDILPIVKL